MVATIFIAIGLIIFIQFTGKLHSGELNAFDKGVTDFLFSLRTPQLNKAMTFITEFGNYRVYFGLLVIVGVSLYFAKHKWSKSLIALTVLISSFLINIALKAYYGRLRPDPEYWLVDLTEGSLSYPSGHSMTAMAFYGFIIYLIHRSPLTKGPTTILSIFLGLLILMIGITRIYLGAHYPTDVVAGFVAGFAWLMLCISIVRYFRHRKTWHTAP